MSDESEQSAQGNSSPEGKKQRTFYLPDDVSKALRVAAAKREVAQSHIVEDAVREWLIEQGEFEKQG